jgi:hypothetical protein
MAFPDPKKYRVYVSDDDSPGSYVIVTGVTAWDRTNDPEGDPIPYMGGEVGAQTRTRTVTLNGLYDPADVGQEKIRDAAEAGTTIYVALIHTFTSVADAVGHKGLATVGPVGDDVDLEGGDRPRMSMEVSFESALTDITALP